MKKIVLLILLLSTILTGYSQTWKRNRIEVFAGLPIAHYFGDIGGTADKTNLMGLKDISIRTLRPGISFGLAYRLNQILYVQGAANIGFIGGSDVGSRNEGRNYGFSTFSNEFTATALFYIIPESEQNYFYSVMQLRGGLRHMNKPFSAYIFAGGGGLIYSVKPKLNLIDSDRFDNTQKFATIIPFGAGIKYKLWARTIIGAELGARFVLSDYIDGFSPAQSKHNDLYYTLTFKLIYRPSVDNMIKKFKSKR